MKLPSFLVILFFMICAGELHLSEKSGKKSVNRKIAEQVFQELITEENQNFQREIYTKLFSLHSHHVMAKKIHFDQKAGIHSSHLTLLTINHQIDEIEDDFVKIFHAINLIPKSKEVFQKQILLRNAIMNFGKENKLQLLSVQRLLIKIGIETKKTGSTISSDEITKEYRRLEMNNEFITYQKNIEHISYKMKVDLKNNKNRG